MSRVYVHSVAAMGTVVTIQAIGDGNVLERSSAGGGATRQADIRAPIVGRALDWFLRIEEVCSRFDETSELRRLCAQVGTPVPVSELLFQTVQFALAVAAETDGAFDPTVGRRMEEMGFNADFRTGAVTDSTGAAGDALGARDLAEGTAGSRPAAGAPVTFRDVVLDPAAHTITLLEPLMLDLGAVAKGLAIDLAARELRPIANFAIDAGGDLYLGGCNEEGVPWRVGIRHPRREGELIETLHVSNIAVCTSGDYERRAGNQNTAGFLASDDAERDRRTTEGVARPVRAGLLAEDVVREAIGQTEGDQDRQGKKRPAHAGAGTAHHIIDARTGQSASGAVSTTVVADSAMVADALATAAFVLGPEAGIRLLESHGVDGLMVTSTLERFATRGMQQEYVRPRPETIGVE